MQYLTKILMIYFRITWANLKSYMRRFSEVFENEWNTIRSAGSELEKCLSIKPIIDSKWVWKVHENDNLNNLVGFNHHVTINLILKHSFSEELNKVCIQVFYWFFFVWFTLKLQLPKIIVECQLPVDENGKHYSQNGNSRMNDWMNLILSRPLLFVKFVFSLSAKKKWKNIEINVVNAKCPQ